MSTKSKTFGDYTKKDVWQAKELHDAMKDANKGVFVSHEAMTRWVDSLGTRKELGVPKPKRIVWDSFRMSFTSRKIVHRHGKKHNHIRNIRSTSTYCAVIFFMYVSTIRAIAYYRGQSR